LLACTDVKSGGSCTGAGVLGIPMRPSVVVLEVAVVLPSHEALAAAVPMQYAPAKAAAVVSSPRLLRSHIRVTLAPYGAAARRRLFVLVHVWVASLHA
jgi:hypothetical protein